MQGLIPVPRKFEALLLLATPCSDKEVSDMIRMLESIRHTEDIVLLIRRLAFERDKLKDQLKDQSK